MQKKDNGTTVEKAETEVAKNEVLKTQLEFLLEGGNQDFDTHKEIRRKARNKRKAIKRKK